MLGTLCLIEMIVFCINKGLKRNKLARCWFSVSIAFVHTIGLDDNRFHPVQNERVSLSTRVLPDSSAYRTPHRHRVTC